MKQVSDRIFDAGGDISKYIDQIKLDYKLNGHVHIINTGLYSKDDLVKVMPSLGFGEYRKFEFGGRASDNTQDKWVVKGLLRNLDYYPNKFYLLPNTEIQYLKYKPQDILFFVDKPTENGGKIFLHDIKKVEKLIDDKLLLSKIREHGLNIITGYVDKSVVVNYMKSWQELSGEENIDKAIEKLKSQWYNYTDVWKDGNTIMTKVYNNGFTELDSDSYLNMPRIAMTPPSLENGFREFTLGDGTSLTSKENDSLRKAYLSSREGNTYSQGDLYLADNTKVAHSRESFEDLDRKVLVGMSGFRFSDDVSLDKRKELIKKWDIKDSQLERFNIGTTNNIKPKALNNSDIRYETPPIEIQMKERFSMQVYDLNGRSIEDTIVLEEIKEEFEKHGRLHIIGNTSIDISNNVINSLGFSEDEQFKWGGKNSGRTIREKKGNGFLSVDKYPSTQPLLPHQEILYQKVLPKRLLFHYRKVSGIGNGGRTLVHSGKTLERVLNGTDVGEKLVNKLRKYGQTIISGFLDENHSEKNNNFARSWQDRFQTDNIEEAIEVCNSSTDQFDGCWLKETDEFYETGEPKYMLMTKITVPMFKDSHMFFPRIAYDTPSIINGYREFIIGNGDRFTDEEVTNLLNGFWDTREGIYQSEGDILLVDNIRYAHSRGAYMEYDVDGNKIERDVATLMAGTFTADFD